MGGQNIRTTNRIAFTVFGLPRPKGSTKSWSHPRTGRIVTTSTTKDLKSWEKLIFWESRKAWDAKPATGRFSVMLDFYFAKPDKPAWPYPPNDLDKLVRGCLDGMTGSVWIDDKHVCSIQAHKHWDEVNRVEIEVLCR